MPLKTSLEVVRKTTKTNRKGGQLGNVNRVSHGAYSALDPEKLDRRTKLSKWLESVQGELTTALGGDPSPQQILLIQSAAVKAAKLKLLEAKALGAKADEFALGQYLRWSRELREDLKALGLERRAKPALDLKSYLEERGGDS